MSLKKFDVICELGAGAFASVFKVKRHEDEQIYALKKVKLMSLSEKQKDNALNQIRILASLKNPHIIAYKQSFLDQQSASLWQDTFYYSLVTEYADNGDLQKRINILKQKNQSAEEKEIWSIFIQIARGLKSLHALNIAHRDLKSANVFLFKSGKVKIGDMNVSKVIKNNLCLTQTGTPYYASPEVWRDIPYNTKSDVWSLGCLIYEMAALHPPFLAESMEGLYKKVLKGIYPKITQKYSKNFRNLIRMMLQIDPQGRPCINTLLQYAENSYKKLYSSEFMVDINQRISQSSKNIGERIKLPAKKIQKQNQQEDCISLLGTIKLPKKMVYLGPKLPKANYEEVSLGQADIKKKISMRMLPVLQKTRTNGQEEYKKQKLVKVRSEKLLPLPGINSKNVLM